MPPELPLNPVMNLLPVSSCQGWLAAPPKNVLFLLYKVVDKSGSLARGYIFRHTHPAPGWKHMTGYQPQNVSKNNVSLLG